jgi:hypothetical protein
MMSDEDKAAMKELINAVATTAVELPEGDTREEYLREWQQEAEWDWRDGGMTPDAAARHAATLESLVREMISVLLRRSDS